MRKLVAVLFVAFALLGMATAQNIKYVGSWSSLSLFKNYEKPFWNDTVPSVLPGVKTTVTTFDQMGLGGGEVFRLLDQGLFDVGSTVADYVVSDAPVLEGLDLPVLAPDISTAQKVANAYKPVLDDAMHQAFNAKLLSIAPYPAQVIFCNTPISSLADLKGKKVRASGRSTAEFVQAVGATGVTLSFSEVPQALQRGVVDCAVTGSTSGYSSGWADVAKYLYPLPIGGWDYVLTAMKLDTWNSLSQDQQQTLLDAINKDIEAKVWAGIGNETQQGINCLTDTGQCDLGKPANMKLVPVSDADIATSRQVLVNDVLPAWASRVGPQWVQRWNDTIGKVTGLTAKAQ